MWSATAKFASCQPSQPGPYRPHSSGKAGPSLCLKGPLSDVVAQERSLGVFWSEAAPPQQRMLGDESSHRQDSSRIQLALPTDLPFPTRT